MQVTGWSEAVGGDQSLQVKPSCCFFYVAGSWTLDHLWSRESVVFCFLLHLFHSRIV